MLWGGRDQVLNIRHFKGDLSKLYIPVQQKNNFESNYAPQKINKKKNFEIGGAHILY